LPARLFAAEAAAFERDGDADALGLADEGEAEALGADVEPVTPALSLDNGEFAASAAGVPDTLPWQPAHAVIPASRIARAAGARRSFVRVVTRQP
jgi:hypothetical protein